MTVVNKYNRRFGFIIILAAYVCTVGIYSYIIPAWESPDEPAHYLYVKHLGTTWRPPGRNPVKRVGHYWEGGYLTSMYEWYHPAMGYIWPALIWGTLNSIQPENLPNEFPEVSLGNPNANGFDRGLFMSERSRPWEVENVDIGLISLRFLNALLGLPLLWAVYKGGKLLYEGNNAAAVMTSVLLAGFIPQFGFIMGTLRNDASNNMMSALSILAMLFIIGQEIDTPLRYGLLSGLLVALTLLTKSTGSFLIPAAILAVMLSPYTLSTKIKLAVIFALVVFVFVGLYYLAYPETREAFVYNSTHVKIKPNHLNLRYLLSLVDPFTHLFWARFGWASVQVPRGWIWLSTFFSLTGIGLSLVISTGVMKGITLKSVQKRQIIFLIAVILTNLTLIIYYNFFLTQPQGRFLFPSMLPISLLSFWGFSQLISLIQGKWRSIIQWCLFVGVVLYLGAFNYVAVFRSIIPEHYLIS